MATGLLRVVVLDKSSGAEKPVSGANVTVSSLDSSGKPLQSVSKATNSSGYADFTYGASFLCSISVSKFGYLTFMTKLIIPPPELFPILPYPVILEPGMDPALLIMIGGGVAAAAVTGIYLWKRKKKG